MYEVICYSAIFEQDRKNYFWWSIQRPENTRHDNILLRLGDRKRDLTSRILQQIRGSD